MGSNSDASKAGAIVNGIRLNDGTGQERIVFDAGMIGSVIYIRNASEKQLIEIAGLEIFGGRVEINDSEGNTRWEVP